MHENNQITLIENLIPENQTDNKIIHNLDSNSLSDYIVDLSISIEERIKYIEEFCIRFGETDGIEIVNRLSSMYQMSGTKILEKYMYELADKKCKIPTFLKIIAAKSLCYFNPKNSIGYEALDSICNNFSDNDSKFANDIDQISTPVKIEAICLLMLHTLYKKQARDYFCYIINNILLDCDYRYKSILSLENKDIPEKNFFIKEAAFEFFNHNENQTLYRILAGQLIIQKYNPVLSERIVIEKTLLSFANDTTLEYNIRADSADVILKLGSTENKIKAKEVIMILGTSEGNSKTIFENAQNVHTDDIEESVIEAIEFLSTIDTKTISGIPGSPCITFEYVKKQIDNMVKNLKPKKSVKSTEYKIFESKRDAINISLNRIYLDRALYSKFNYTLINILLKVWTYICFHDSEIEMGKRLIEELVEMSGTCSSGFAGRLVNVISGFGDFNIRISFRDQIIANFTGRLNAKARDIANHIHLDINRKLYGIKEIPTIELSQQKNYYLNKLSSFQEDVLEEMSITSNDYSSRLNFLKFFRKNMLSIREELYTEFKPHITDTDFDLYFRAAISSYETGGYV
jgi:hypothetical protein